MKRILILLLALLNGASILFAQENEENHSMKVTYCKDGNVQLQIDNNQPVVSKTDSIAILPYDSIAISSYMVELEESDRGNGSYAFVINTDSIIPFWNTKDGKHNTYVNTGSAIRRSFSHFTTNMEDPSNNEVKLSDLWFKGVIKFYSSDLLRASFRMTNNDEPRPYSKLKTDTLWTEKSIKNTLGLGDFEKKTYRILHDTTFSIKINHIDDLKIIVPPMIIIDGGDTINGTFRNDTISFVVEVNSISTDTLQPIQLLIAVEAHGQSFEVPIGLGSIQRIKTGWNLMVFILIALSFVVLICILALVLENSKWKKHGTQIKDKDGILLFTVLSKEEPKVGDRVRVKKAGIYDTKLGYLYEIGGKKKKTTIEGVYCVICGKDGNNIHIDCNKRNNGAKTKAEYELPDGKKTLIYINQGDITKEDTIQIETPQGDTIIVSKNKVTEIKLSNKVRGDNPPKEDEKETVNHKGDFTVIKKLWDALDEQRTTEEQGDNSDLELILQRIKELKGRPTRTDYDAVVGRLNEALEQLKKVPNVVKQAMNRAREDERMRCSIQQVKDLAEKYISIENYNKDLKALKDAENEVKKKDSQLEKQRNLIANNESTILELKRRTETSGQEINKLNAQLVNLRNNAQKKNLHYMFDILDTLEYISNSFAGVYKDMTNERIKEGLIAPLLSGATPIQSWAEIYRNKVFYNKEAFFGEDLYSMEESEVKEKLAQDFVADMVKSLGFSHLVRLYQLAQVPFIRKQLKEAGMDIATLNRICHKTFAMVDEFGYTIICPTLFEEQFDDNKYQFYTSTSLFKYLVLTEADKENIRKEGKETIIDINQIGFTSKWGSRKATAIIPDF